MKAAAPSAGQQGPFPPKTGNSNSAKVSGRYQRMHPFTLPCITLYTALTNDAAIASVRCQFSNCGCAASSLAEPNSGIVGPMNHPN